MTSRWPPDNQDALIRFYGMPGPQVEAQLVPVVPPFTMYYDGKPIKAIKFHKKAAGALNAALHEIWDHYGHDQTALDKLGISHYDGAYNPRKVRGSATKWSNHAYGAAIDINAEHNGFNTGHGNMPQPVIDAFKHQGARWGGDYHHRTDPMHFEFCDPGDAPVGLFEPPPTDADSDANADPLPSSHSPMPEEYEASETKTPWYKKIWTWASGGGIGMLGGGLYDWRVAVALGVLAFIIFVIVWFTYLRKKLEKDG